MIFQFEIKNKNLQWTWKYYDGGEREPVLKPGHDYNDLCLCVECIDKFQQRALSR